MKKDEQEYRHVDDDSGWRRQHRPDHRDPLQSALQTKQQMQAAKASASARWQADRHEATQLAPHINS
jgi:hypothetical protein